MPEFVKSMRFLIIAVLLWGGDYCYGGLGSPDTAEVIPIEAPNPAAISISPSGMIFVLDRSTNEIRKFSPGGSLLARAGGFGVGSDDALDAPMDFEVPNDLQVLVADYGNHRIVEYDGRLNRVSIIPGDLQQTGERVFGFPKSVATDRFGAMFIVDGENLRIVKLDPSRVFERAFGGSDAGSGRLRSPSRIRVGENDRVYVQDGATLMMYDLFGNFLGKMPLDSAAVFCAVKGDAAYLLVGKTLCRRSESADTTIILPVDSPPVDAGIVRTSLELLFPGEIMIVPSEFIRQDN